MGVAMRELRAEDPMNICNHMKSGELSKADSDSGVDLGVMDFSVPPGVSGESALPWYALYVRPNTERAVARTLRERGYEAFAPCYRLKRRWSDRIVEKSFPLFPGYIFSRLDLQHRLPVVSTGGVIRIVGFGGTAVEVPREEIRWVRELAESRQGASPHPFLRSGRRVKVCTGPLSGVEGILVKWKGTLRLVVSVSMLQRSVAAEVDSVDVRPI